MPSRQPLEELVENTLGLRAQELPVLQGRNRHENLRWLLRDGGAKLTVDCRLWSRSWRFRKEVRRRGWRRTDSSPERSFRFAPVGPPPRRPPASRHARRRAGCRKYLGS